MGPLVVSIEFMVANKIVGYMNGVNGLIHSSNDSIGREYGAFNVNDGIKMKLCLKFIFMFLNILN